MGETTAAYGPCTSCWRPRGHPGDGAAHAGALAPGEHPHAAEASEPRSREGLPPAIRRLREALGSPYDLVEAVVVDAGAYGAHPVLGEPFDAHGGGHLLHLPGAGPCRVHLGSGDRRAVDPLVELDDIIGEGAARAELRYAQRERSHASDQITLAVAFPAVAGGAAELVGLGAHDLVRHKLGQSPQELLEVDRPVLEAGRHRRRRGRLICYAAHCGHCSSLEPDLLRFQILGSGRTPFARADSRLHQHFRQDHADC